MFDIFSACPVFAPYLPIVVFFANKIISSSPLIPYNSHIYIYYNYDIMNVMIIMYIWMVSHGFCHGCPMMCHIIYILYHISKACSIYFTSSPMFSDFRCESSGRARSPSPSRKKQEAMANELRMLLSQLMGEQKQPCWLDIWWLDLFCDVTDIFPGISTSKTMRIPAR